MCFFGLLLQPVLESRHHHAQKAYDYPGIKPGPHALKHVFRILDHSTTQPNLDYA